MRATTVRILTLGLVLCTAVAASLVAAGADPAGESDGVLAPIYTDWIEGPARHLLTAEDRKQWSQLASDAEAEDFIRLFWARRDPLPETADNELQREFERRVAFADLEFAETGNGGEEIRGSQTDRGRVLILLGPPKRRQMGGAQGAETGGDFGLVEARRGAEPGQRDIQGDGTRVSGRGATTERFGLASNEIWVYEDEALPTTDKGAARLEVVFRTEPGKDRSELLDNPRLGGYLLGAIQGAVVRPELSLVDLGRGSGTLEVGEGFGLYGAMTLGAAATELDTLRQGAPGSAGQGDFSAAVFRASDGTWIVPLQVVREDGSDREGSTVVGELTDRAGESKLAFRIHPGAPDAAGQRFARATLVTPPGDYRLAVGVLGPNGGLRWRGEKQISVPATRHELWLSDVVLSRRVFTLQRPQELLEPWTWQGVMVVPDGDRTFRQGELLWYYFHVCQPRLDEESQPQIQVALDLEGEFNTSGQAKIDPFQVGDHCWVLAQAYDLVPDRFPAGEYTMGITVRDLLADSSIAAEPVSFTVLPAAR